MRVALATCHTLPEPDPDQELLVEALRAVGVAAELVPWDGPPRDLSGFALCLLRSTWNYYRHVDAFAAWLAAAERETRVLNPPAVVRGNLSKRYLLELEARGVAVLPTALVPRGGGADLGRLAAEHGWDDVVVKPAVSAASWRTRRFRRGELDAGQAFLADLLRDGDALVQRYEPAFEVSGERALVWIDGAFTHAVRKRPRFAGEEEEVSGALPLSAAEQAFGERVLAPLAGELCYARVDVVPGPDGEPRLSELELIEPSLFLAQHPPALARLAARVLREARSSR